jgi:hypothetical protein
MDGRDRLLVGHDYDGRVLFEDGEMAWGRILIEVKGEKREVRSKR